MKRFPILTALLVGALLLPATEALAATEVDKLTASDAGPGDQFGEAVAVSGTDVLVGAPLNDTGLVYLHDCSSLPCIEVSILSASDGAAFDLFGVEMAASGSTVIVGATGDDDGAGGTGSAYVFDLSICGATCTEVSKLTASDAAMFDFLGSRVAVSGTTAVVGALDDDDSGDASGSAYVFDLSTCGAACNEVSKLTASDAAAGDKFGDVAVSGTTVLVGASLRDDVAGVNSGAAYLFDLSTCGAACNEVDKLTPSDAAAGDSFGSSVALDGSTAVVGASGAVGGPDTFIGSAYVFDCAGLSCTEVSKLTASDQENLDFFGFPVALDGTTAVVGSFGDNNFTGAAYLFDLATCGAACTEVDKLTASDGAASDSLGISVALSDSTVVAGARQDDDGGDDSGSAYVFQVAPPEPDEPTIYLSPDSKGSVDGVSFSDTDVIAFHDGEWSMVFDGSDVGLSRQDVGSIHLIPDDDGGLPLIILSLKRAQPLTDCGGDTTRFDDSDIVVFEPTTLGPDTAGCFVVGLYGSDFGLTARSEKLDAIGVTEGGEGSLVLSTSGSFRVPKDGGGILRGRDADLFILSGSGFEMFFDGSDVGLSTRSEDVVGTWIDPESTDIYLTTHGNFSVPGLSGDRNDIFVFSPDSLGESTSGTFSLFWDGDAHGFSGPIDAIHIDQLHVNNDR